MKIGLVLARAYMGEPTKAVEVERRPGVVFLSHPDMVSKVKANQVEPVGFPEEDIFEFDSDLYELLTSEWDAGQRPPTSWAAARPLFD